MGTLGLGGAKSDKNGQNSSRRDLTAAKGGQRGGDPGWGDTADERLRARGATPELPATHSTAPERRFKESCRREDH